eukprot:XP_014038349.1 PREDICTED: attractin-like [Salmo salar]
MPIIASLSVSKLSFSPQIAFSQHSNFMDLVQFFVTFFSCFLSLLLVAAVVWKIKQSCWASRRREVSGYHDISVQDT